MGEDKSLLQKYDLHGGKCGVPSVFKYLLMKTGRILEEMAMGNYFLLWEPGARGISIPLIHTEWAAVMTSTMTSAATAFCCLLITCQVLCGAASVTTVLYLVRGTSMGISS